MHVRAGASEKRSFSPNPALKKVATWKMHQNENGEKRFTKILRPFGILKSFKIRPTLWTPREDV
mgnify:CR=1 FL=1|jgi:hypothetical protein|tara:strand:+ start:335 stop:526 length:192 start_codon:yes stop_codon:yes gene_type:complete